MIPQSYIEYYGDQTRWFIGVVIDINDPYALGRVKVRIFGIHSENVNDIPDKDLPWAQTVVPITEGGSSGTGATVGIQVKAQVFGMFLDGKSSQLPLVLGSIPKFELPSSAPEQQAKKETTPNPPTKPQEVDDPDSKFLKGNTNVERAYNYFISEEGGEYSPFRAAAIVGNFLQESGPGDLRTTAISKFKGKYGKPENSVGIAQWFPGGSPSRLSQLYEYSSKINLPWNSLYAQLNFAKHELLTTEKGARRYLLKANDVDEATFLFARFYERPASEKGKKYYSKILGREDKVPLHLDRRQSYARKILEDFR